MLKILNFKQFKHSFSYKFFTTYFLSVSLYRTAIFIGLTAITIQTKDIEGNKPFYESIISLCYNVPLLLLTPLAGVLADRLHRIKVIKYLQLYFMFLSLLVFLSSVFDKTSMNLLIVSSSLFGIGMAIDNPSRYSLVKDIVYNPKDLSSGMGIFSIVSRASLFIGSGLTGFLVYLFNAATCHIINFFSYLLTFFILFKIKPKKQIIKKEKFHFISDLKEGMVYTIKHFSIKISIFFIALNGLFAWPYLFQLPIINSYYLNGNALTLGIIMGLGGIGGALAGLYMGGRKNFLGLTKHILTSLVCIGISFIVFSLSKNIWLTSIATFFLDFFLTLFMITSTTFVQLITEDSKRGRVMGFFAMANSGLLPVGSIVVYGVLGTYFGLMNIILAGGIIFIIAAIVYYILLNKIRSHAHIILRAKNIIQPDETLII